jgi:hypothetical protein
MNRNRSSRRPLLTHQILFTLLLFCAAGSAHAATVITDTGGTNATAILDLDFLGNLYDVTFIDDTAFNVYGDPLDLDFPLTDVARLARDSVNEALNLEPAVSTVGPSAINDFDIGTGTFDFFSVGGRFDDPTSDWVVGSDDTTVSGNSRRTWAKFTVVPEPGTALLMGLGLAGLGAAGRLRRQTTD